MKLLLLSLVLIGIALIDATQARTIEKREVNEEKGINIESNNSVCTCQDGECNRCDDNGCNPVSNCDGNDIDIEKRQSGFDEHIKMFTADNSSCKCLNHGYCMERKPHHKEYTEVRRCGERRCYTHCDSTGCKEVCDGQCKCDNGHCEKCDDKGCVQVRYCKEMNTLAIAENCQECDEYGCEEVECNRLCNDNTGDNLFQDKCVCNKDNNGTESCQMCGKYKCHSVADCSSFATCTSDIPNDSYRRCYGFTHGEYHCRKMYSATEFKKRDEEWKMESERLKSALGNVTNVNIHSCECPSNGGTCKMCLESGQCGYYKSLQRYKYCNDNKDHYNVTAHLH